MKRPKKCDNRQLNRQTDSEKERWGKRKKNMKLDFILYLIKMKRGVLFLMSPTKKNNQK